MRNIWSGHRKIAMHGASMLNWKNLYLRQSVQEASLSLQLLNLLLTCQKYCGRYCVEYFVLYKNDCYLYWILFWFLVYWWYVFIIGVYRLWNIRGWIWKNQRIVREIIRPDKTSEGMDKLCKVWGVCHGGKRFDRGAKETMCFACKK